MKILIALLLPTLLYANGPSIVVKDTLYRCSNRLPESIFEEMRDLSTLHENDNIPKGKKNEMQLLGITLLDMIQSKQRVSQTQVEDSISTVDLLLVLKPLPKKINLSREYFPRFIIQCSTFKKNETSSIHCKQISNNKAFGVNDFTMGLTIRKNPESDTSCPTQAVIKYYAEIDKADFKKIKDQSFKLMGTNGFLKVLANLFANPKLFFKTYWEGFYDHWINA